MSILEMFPEGVLRHASGEEWCGPCPRCQGDDRFRVWSREDRFWCRRCEWKGDEADLLSELGQIPLGEALHLVGKGLMTSAPMRATWPPRRSPEASWQGSPEDVVRVCEAALWSSSGTKPQAWLRRRGLSETTLRAARIGYNPESRMVAGLWVPGGIVIPWVHRGQVEAIKVRVPEPEGGCKYKGVKGSKPSLFNSDALASRSGAFLVESELCALLVHQEAAGLAACAAFGTNRPKMSATILGRIHHVQSLWLCYDHDEPGQDKAASLLARHPKRLRPAHPLNAKDPTEAHQAGINLREWVLGHLAAEAVAKHRDHAGFVEEAIRVFPGSEVVRGELLG